MSKIHNIQDRKEAGLFTREVIRQNFDVFASFAKTKDAFKQFKASYPNVNVTYDNFWSHLKKVKEEKGIFDQGKSKLANVAESNQMLDLQMPVQIAPEELEIVVYDPHKEIAKEEIFIPYKSGKFIDNIISKNAGCMPGTTQVWTGGPSVGKTTAALDTLHHATLEFISHLKTKALREEAKKEFLYFSSEMKKVDLQAEENEKEWMKDIRSVLMSEYDKSKYKALVEKVITYGYRMLVIDSFQNIVERLVSFCSMTTTEASNFLLNCIEKANTGDTTTGHNTAIILIQQVTKGGVFVGKNNLKHDTTAMAEFRFDGLNERYIEFTKNRRNGRLLFKKLYYFMNDNNEVQYDEKRWNEDRERELMITRERTNMEQSTDDFSNLFLKKQKNDGEEEYNLAEDETEEELF